MYWDHDSGLETALQKRNYRVDLLFIHTNIGINTSDSSFLGLNCKCWAVLRQSEKDRDIVLWKCSWNIYWGELNPGHQAEILEKLTENETYSKDFRELLFDVNFC